MATPIQMPALSPTMTEGKITKWLKKEGEKVTSGEAIAEVETDKSNLEIEAYDDGVLLQIAVREGEMAKVGAPIAFVGQKGEQVGDASAKAAPALKAAPAPAAPPAAQASAPAAPAPNAPASAPAASPRPLMAVPPPEAEGGSNGRVRASPLAKKIASEQGLDLAAMAGSGPSGRIVKRDVEAAMSQGGAAVAVARRGPVAVRSRQAEPQSLPISSMRKVIAQRMAEVKPGVPHFYLSIEVEMDAGLQLREEAKAMEQKISVNDLIVKAAGVALQRVPKMNVSFQGDHTLQFSGSDVGIAVAIEEGLITPVIRDVDQKSVTAIAAEAKSLAERARKRSLKPDEYAGGSITVSNLGMYGIDSFIAVINPPQAAILAVGAVAEKPVVRDGQVVVRKMMNVMLSGDHRVIDGALGAVYLKELKELLEHPLRLLL